MAENDGTLVTDVLRVSLVTRLNKSSVKLFIDSGADRGKSVSVTDKALVEVIPFIVKFRQLDDGQIERYLQQDQPYHCAGSFKSEGLGIALFEYMEGTDPTALIGLPLIRLTGMLAQAGIILP